MGEKTPNGSRRASLELEVPPLPSFSARTFKRKKQVAPEPKPEIDLTSALPASDDFRTSLLMPNLSARFSMLREQDDPSSKIGKANDDSVLFPKRASRLDLFNRQGLSDISEVDSIRGSIRPPFAQTRTESYGSGGYDTDEGSVISRSRPGEGNTMFGGRQKIYKIPVNGSGSVKNFGSTDDGELPAGRNMGGKALYESDIATSAFQRLREEQKRQESERLDQHDAQASKEQDRSGSPPSAKYNRNRETSSSTNSGPSQPRNSTAATSVASQKSIYGAHEAINGSQPGSSNAQPGSTVSDRPLGKNRRLYGQGLDQHMYDQQSSALHRLESIQRSRTPVGGPVAGPASKNLPQSRSATNLNDRFQRGGPLYASNGFCAGSPPPSATPSRMQEFDLGLTPDDVSNDRPVDSGYGRSPPMSPLMSPSHDLIGQDATFVAALEPNDLGKATASGAFNKPPKQYNEQQYLQRQLALQEGRGTPSPQLVRPFSPQAFSNEEHATGRSRNNSLGSTLSRTNSFRQPWEHHMEDRVLRAVPEGGSPPSSSNHEDQNDQNFLNGMTGSEIGSESEADPNSPMPSTEFPSFSLLNQQPKPVALPSQLNFNPNANTNHLQSPPEDTSDSQSYRSGTTITQQPPQQNGSPPGTEKEPAIEMNSPTLGPFGVSNGLSGLVHQHLRNDSGTSSIYPDESPDIEPMPAEIRNSIFGHASALSHSRQPSRETNGEEMTKEPNPSNGNSVAPLSFAARHILEQATALRNNQNNSKANQMLGNNKAQQILGAEAPRDHPTNWQDQLKAHHARVGSTETQNEREALANELAERRRKVQDNLKNFVGVDDKSEIRTRENSPAKPMQPLGIPKTASGEGSSAEKQERPTKAMKMLGIGPGMSHDTVTGPDRSRPPPNMSMGRSQGPDRAGPPRQRLPPHPSQRPQDVRQHSDTPPSRQRETVGFRSQENLTRRPSPPSSKSDSASSDISDRRSPEARNGNMTGDNLQRPRANGYSPNGAGPALATNKFSLDAPRPTNELMARHGGPPAERSQSAMSNRMRSRSNSKTATNGHFEPRVAPPGTPYMINPSTSRNAHPHAALSGSTLNEPRPSFSSASSPTMLPPQKSPTRRAFNRPNNHRKQSINKHDISEPTFISCTSSVDTVNLPEGASLSNGMDSRSASPGPNAPPIPARDSRRKRTQTLLHALGRIEKPEPSPSSIYSPSPKDDDPYEERSTFSADDEPAPRSGRGRLRKTSSEVGSMAQKARQQALNAPSPAVPNVEVPAAPNGGSNGGHVQYQARQDVPASAVMF